MIDTQRKAGSVILANLAMFDESVVLFENEISPAFLKAFDKVVDDFAKEESWFVVASFADDEDCCWFALPSWNMGIEDRNDYSAWLAVTNYSDGDNSFYLANLCGIGEALGFKFSVGAKHFGAILSKEGRSPIIVTEEMVSEMRFGSVVIDVSIDQGGNKKTLNSIQA